MTWYRHAIAYAELKWPRLAPHSAGQPGRRPGHRHAAADPGNRPPTARKGRCALPCTGMPFNPHQRRSRAPDPGTVGTLAWLERVSLPVGPLSDPHVIRTILDGLCTRLDGSPAAANTISRKRAVFHAALGYAVELGLLPANPGREGAVARAQSRRGRQPCCSRQPSAGPGDPGPGLACPAGTCRVLQLPVLRGAAPGGSRRRAPRGPHPPGARPWDDHPHRGLPAHRHRLD